ncbi:MAG TPA: thioesterase family protein [Rhizomicrobium sp.]|nr:thioesterase family protein [Rhizomicrobium sp.]
MTAFTELLSSFEKDGDNFRVSLTDDWAQGRTAYGGLSAAFCVETALRTISDLPPLRSAQFALIGPASGALKLKADVLRRGKSTAFVNVDLMGEAGLAARAILSFGVARNSALAYADLPMPPVKSIGDSPSFFGDRPTISFLQQFESRMAGGARPFSPKDDPEYLIWFRHRDARAREGIVPLIALADAPPPASMVIFPQPAPISTMTWSMDVLTDDPQTRDGWWLIQSRTETAWQGYSTQSMMVWNADGEPVIAHRQNVAIFV